MFREHRKSAFQPTWGHTKEEQAWEKETYQLQRVQVSMMQSVQSGAVSHMYQ